MSIVRNPQIRTNAWHARTIGLPTKCVECAESSREGHTCVLAKLVAPPCIVIRKTEPGRPIEEIGCRYIKDGNVEHLIMFLEFFDLFFVVVVLTIQKGEIR